MYKLYCSVGDSTERMVVDKRGKVVAGTNGYGAVVTKIEGNEEFVTAHEWKQLQDGVAVGIFDTVYCSKSRAKVIRMMQIEAVIGS